MSVVDLYLVLYVFWSAVYSSQAEGLKSEVDQDMNNYLNIGNTSFEYVLVD